MRIALATKAMTNCIITRGSNYAGQTFNNNSNNINNDSNSSGFSQNRENLSGFSQDRSEYQYDRGGHNNNNRPSYNNIQSRTQNYEYDSTM